MNGCLASRIEIRYRYRPFQAVSHYDNCFFLCGLFYLLYILLLRNKIVKEGQTCCTLYVPLSIKIYQRWTNMLYCWALSSTRLMWRTSLKRMKPDLGMASERLQKSPIVMGDFYGTDVDGPSLRCDVSSLGVHEWINKWWATVDYILFQESFCEFLQYCDIIGWATEEEPVKGCCCSDLKFSYIGGPWFWLTVEDEEAILTKIISSLYTWSMLTMFLICLFNLHCNSWKWQLQLCHRL